MHTYNNGLAVEGDNTMKKFFSKLFKVVLCAGVAAACYFGYKKFIKK